MSDRCLGFFLVVFLLGSGELIGGSAERPSEAIRKPLLFEPNRGQLPSHVRFAARGNGYEVVLTDESAEIRLRRAEDGSVASLSLEVVDGSPATLAAEQPLEGRMHYTLGADPSGWVHDVPTYGRVVSRSVYPGIDLAFYGNETQLEFDFIVAPGADASRITFELAGASDCSIDGAGHLQIEMAREGTIAFRRPFAYQRVGSEVREVPAEFVVEGERVRFALGAYDPALPLVIDPIADWSRYIGGTGDDRISGVALAPNGEVVVTGVWMSPSIVFSPASAAGEDSAGTGASGTEDPPHEAFIAKFAVDGTHVFTHVFGGKWRDEAVDLAIDANGNIYVTGWTESIDFPTTPDSFMPRQPGTDLLIPIGGRDGFVIKFPPGGAAPLYSTYLGSPPEVKIERHTSFLNPVPDTPSAIAVADNGWAYVVGSTIGFDFPVRSNAWSTELATFFEVVPVSDAWASVIDTTRTGDDSYIYGTYYGGLLPDDAEGVAVNSKGEFYVVGDLATEKVFVLKIDPTRADSLIWDRVFVGAGQDLPYAVAVDHDDNVYVTGATFSSNFLNRVSRPGSYFTVKMSGEDGAILWDRYHGFVAGPNDIAVRSLPGYSEAFVIFNDDEEAGRGVSVRRFLPDGHSFEVSRTDVNGPMRGRGIAADARNVYYGGWTRATDLPLALNGHHGPPATTDAPAPPDGFLRRVQYSPPPTVTGLAATGVKEGDDDTLFELATVARSNSTPTVFTAAINWGDQTPNDDQTMEVARISATISSGHAYRDNGIYEGSVCLTEQGDPIPVCAPFTVEVENVAPTIAADIAVVDQETPFTLFEPDPEGGVRVTLNSIATVFDAGSADTHTASIRWESGGTFESATVTPLTRAVIAGRHTYTSGGSHTVTVCATDDDGATTVPCADFTVVIPEADVQVTMTGPTTSSECSTLTYEVTLTNEGPDVANNVNLFHEIDDPRFLAHLGAIGLDGGSTVTSGTKLDHSRLSGDLSHFGRTVVADGDTIAVASSSGIFIYERDPATFSWTRVAILDATGEAMDLRGDWLVATRSGFRTQPTGPPDFRGEAKIFRRVGGVWQPTPFQTLTPEAVGDFLSKEYGEAVAISDTTLVVGDGWRKVGAGAVYIYRWNGSSWDFQSRIEGPEELFFCSDGGSDPVLCSTRYGASVALDKSGTVLAVGAADDRFDDEDRKSGSVFLYRWDGSEWTDIQFDGRRLLAPDQQSPAAFGAEVALNEGGTLLAVGAPRDDGPAAPANPQPRVGSVYVFEIAGSSVTFEAKLYASDAAANGSFGTHIDMSGTSILVGPNHDSAYLFTLFRSTWGQLLQFRQADAETGDAFGEAVAISGANIVIGARNQGDDDCPPGRFCSRTGNTFVYSSCLSPSGVGSIRCNVGALNRGESRSFLLQLRLGAARSGAPPPLVHTARAIAGAADPTLPNAGSVTVNAANTAASCSSADVTGPVITPVVTGNEGDNGWYRAGTVDLSWTVHDVETDLTGSSGCEPSAVTTDTNGTTFTCTATSHGGTTTRSVTIRRDSGAPTIAASTSTFVAPDGTTATRVHFTCADPAVEGVASGVGSCPSNLDVLPGGIATGVARDRAGNQAMLSVTMPRAFAGNDQTITTPTCSAQVALSGSGAVEGGGPVQLDWRANGVSLASGASATVELPAGVNLVELVATNAAGISSSDVVVITVVPDQIPIFDTVPDPITVDQGTSPLTPVSVPLATAHGACGPATVVSNAPDRFPAGTSPVVFTATDGLGKIASAATTVTVNPRVDLSIHRDEIPAPRRGEVVTYEYDIQNAGPGPAIGIVVDIDFSRPLTFVPYSNECTPGGAYCEDLEFLADGALCDLKEDGGMTCRFGSLDRSEIRSFSIRHRIGANDSGTITDTANVSAAGTDTNPANDTVQTSSTISVSVNLSVNGSVPDSSFPVVAGTIETIRVFVANTGEDVATQTVMEAELPAGVTFVSGDGCSAEGATVRCQVGSLAAFTGSRAALFDVRLDPSLEVLTFPLTVSSAEHDVQTENNRSELSPTAVSSESDLTVSLASEGDLVPGADFTVLATLANLGPSDARHNTLQMFILALLADGVTLGPLPAGCAQVTHLGPIGKQRIDCPDIRIDVGTSESFAFTFRLPPEDRTPPSRIVADAVGPSDIDDENNRAELTPALVPVANLVLTAAGDSAPVIAGETGTWTTTVTNQGPSQATGVVISAALPDDVTFDAAASPGCALSDGLVTCSVGALSPGDPPATVTVAGGIDGLARNSVSLPFSAGATESDPSPENEVAFENAVEVSIDQKLTMSVPAEVVAGQSLEWTATVSNAGPSTATAVTVALTLPTELREASGEDCTPNETGLTCVVATLAGGDSHEFQLTADVDPFAREPLAIAASVDAAETDENPGDNAAPNASVSILTDVELSLSVVSPDSAIAGETFDSAISVTNGGPSGATSVLVSLPAPEGTFAGDLGEGCEESAGGIECRTEALGPEGTQTFTIPLRIDPSARGKLVIDASMVAAEDDIPKTAGAATQIDALVDVSVAGTAPAEIVAGTELVYNLTIGNAGPSTATKPSLTVTLPPGVVPVSHEGCSTSSSVVTCTGDDLLPGASHEYQIIADVGPFERGDHDATLLGSAVETDSQPTNNEETITVNVTASADLSLALVDSPDPAVAGNVVTYLLTASNAGKSGATGVGIDVDLPPNAFFASASPECTRDGASLHCALGDMDVSASREIELRLVPMTAGSLVLSAEIHSQDPDPDAANNVASATTAVSGQGGGAAGAGDLDGDGDLDLAAVDTTADELVLFENDGGALAERLRVPVGHRPVSLALGDLDGDGRLDLAVANSVSNDVSIVRNESAWSFAETERPPIRGRGASSIAIGDFDGDGRLDLATSNELTADVSILLNRDAIAESYVVPLPGKGPAKHPSSIAAGDLDGDGRLDLAIANGVANSVSILTSGGGTFAGTALVTLGGGALHPSAMTIGDFNADGRLDLAVANREGNSISIVWNEGTGAFLAGDPVAVSKDPVAIAAADLDGNGRLDLAAALRTADAISVLFSGEDGFAAETIVETGKKPVAIVIGDFDGDGRLDLVTIGSPKVVPTIHLGR